MPTTRPPGAPVTFADVCAWARELPGVEEGTSYGTPALLVRGKTIARLWEDGTTLVLKVPPLVRDHLLASAPDVFFLTDHYRGYPTVLVRLAAAEASQLTPLLQEAWRQVASKRAMAAYDAHSAAAPGERNAT